MKEKKKSAVIIAVANHKGGVAKTTSTLSISHSLTRKGYRTLMIDLDPQANLTFSLLRDDVEFESVYDVIKNGKEELPVIEIKKGLDLTPSSLNLASLELTIMGQLQRENILDTKVKNLRDKYDFILIDCPPSLGIFTINAFVAADYILIPTTAEVLPFQGLGSLVSLIAQISKRINPKLAVLGILLTKYKPRTNLTKNIEEAIGKIYGPLLMNSRIRETTRAAEAPYEKSSVLEYAPNSTAAKDYEAATDEIIKRLNGSPDA